MPLPVPARTHVRARTAAALAAALLLVAPVALAAPAAAHDELLSTDPADGASLAEAPSVITLTFGEDAQKLGTAVVVTDSAGAKLNDGPTAVDGPLVTQAITAPTAAGEVRVSYRVVSSDGHPVTGTIRFVVTAAPSPTAAPSSSAPASPTAEASTPTASSTAGSPAATSSSPAPVASPSTSPVSSESSGGSVLPWVLGGLAVLALAGAAVAASRRGRAGSGS